MRVVALQSGSSGNCIHVEARGVRLLFDAGISGKQAALRLAAAGGDIRAADALLISHDHADHVRCAGIFQRKFGLPLYVTEPTLRAATAAQALGPLGDVRHFTTGETLRFGPEGRVRVETIPTPHDAADGCVFVVDDGRQRLGILTDLGHVFADLPAVVESLDAVLLESNNDLAMLEAGPYPVFLKQRILGPEGHISNDEAAELLVRSGRRLRWACLAHLSGENNTPAVALETHRAIVGEQLPLHLAWRSHASEALEV
ncbi:MAG: MBL fold metallo-hydrolase [Candidatus Eiseniibacteriota bacterium]|jgi:phosphoribosyl 1,2-cyclic phosphodiesterase